MIIEGVTQYMDIFTPCTGLQDPSRKAHTTAQLVNDHLGCHRIMDILTPCISHKRIYFN